MKLLPILLALPLVSLADVDAKFTRRKGEEARMVIWVRMDNDRLQRFCAMASDRQGSFLGCAVPEPSGRCTIYTSTETTHAVLGHELRHCYEGAFHD